MTNKKSQPADDGLLKFRYAKAMEAEQLTYEALGGEGKVDIPSFEEWKAMYR